MGQRAVEIIYKLKALIRVETKSWMEGRMSDHFPDGLNHWMLLCKTVKPAIQSDYISP